MATTLTKIENITVSDHPICPECNTFLSRGKSYTEPSNDGKYWYCTDCHTVWDTPTLIQALNSVQELAESLGKIEYLGVGKTEDDW